MSANRPATITTTQMQHLHALLRDHGIHGDVTVHDWIAVWLEEHNQEPVESRRDIATTDAAKMIRDLEAAEVPVATVVNKRGLRDLRAPFGDEAIGKLPRSTCRECSKSQRKRCDQHEWVSRCGVCNGSHTSAAMHIDYVGHADVTARLLEVDPTWTWEPMALDPQSGMPILDRTGGLWIRLTVLGVTRPGYGDVTGTGGVKEAIGDALRNAAMRFGVALDLWAKGDRDWAHAEKWDATVTHPDQAPPTQSTPPEYRGPDTAALLLQIDQAADSVAITYEAITEKLRTSLGQAQGRGPLTLDELDDVDPWLIAPAAAAIREHAAKVVKERAEAASAEAHAAIVKAEEEAAAAADPWATPSPGATGEQPPA